VGWEYFWAGKREEHWNGAKLGSRWEALLRMAAQVRWARILAIQNEAKRERFKVSEMQKGWLAMDIRLRITGRGKTQRLTFDKG
jgi:hypothetical protein